MANRNVILWVADDVTSKRASAALKGLERALPPNISYCEKQVTKTSPRFAPTVEFRIGNVTVYTIMGCYAISINSVLDALKKLS